MLSDEEKKAIEGLFHLAHINTYLDLEKEDVVKISRTLIDQWRDKTEILLNLIEKQSKEIEELKAKNEERLTRLFEYEDRLEIYEYKVFNELNNYINMDELQKLDRIGLKGKIYISEDKIKAKIEKLEKELEDIEFKNINKDEISKTTFYFIDRLKCKIDVLQSLLDKE